ncbi:MAG: GldG family protein [Treponema sp.]|jgi:hypothetical protein|nr:GldG family protein [Treponema sp.]
MNINIISAITKSLETRSVKYGGFAAIITIAVIGAVIFLNLIVQQFSPQFDLTENKLFSLSDQTLRVLETMESPVTIYGIWEPGGANPHAQETAKRYAAKSDFIRFEEVDPDLNPGLLKRFDPHAQGLSKGSLVVAGEKGFKVIRPEDMYDVYYNQQQRPQITGVAVEKRITGALLYAGETPKVYEITGHQEPLLSALALKETVERENYGLQEINLFQSAVPEDAAALILNNPNTELASIETERLLAYLEQGGRLLVFLDYRSAAADSVNEVLASYGLRFDYGVVGELDLNYRIRVESPYEFLPVMKTHDIVNPLVEQNIPAFLPLPMGISVLDLRRRTVKITPFLTTSGNSFLRTDLNNTSLQQSPGDEPGPINLGVAVTDPEYSENGRQTRIVAISCGMLLEPPGSQIRGNIDIFMNSLSWIDDRPETLSVQSRSALVMPMSMSALKVLIFSAVFVVLIPLTLFILGLATWLRRRHL